MKSGKAPEDYYNERIALQNPLDFEDSKMLINLFYQLLNIDKRILTHIKTLEDLNYERDKSN